MQIYTKFANFTGLYIFSSFYNISQPNFAILLIILDALSSYGNGFVLLVEIKISSKAGITYWRSGIR
jgi:hypothetical protein